MARDFNQIRNTNAKLGNVTITRYGKTWAIQYGLDGISIVNNEVLPTPTDIKEYLEGNTEIEVYACASNIDKLCVGALMPFPNIVDLYLFKTSEIVVLDDNLTYLSDLEHIYVPTSLLATYQSTYPILAPLFDSIVEDYTLIIPYVGIETLTSEYVDSVIAMLSSAEKTAITKVVIPTDFSEESANAIAWGYNFNYYIPNLASVWYGNTQYDFSVWTIYGSGALTSVIVESSIASIPSSKVSAITKIVIPNTFTLTTSASALCLDAVDTYCPNVDSLEINSSITSQHNGTVILYSNWKNSNCKFKNVYFNYTSIPQRVFQYSFVEYFESNTITAYPYSSSFADSKIKDVKTPFVTTIETNSFVKSTLGYNNVGILFERATKTANGSFGSSQLRTLFVPSMSIIDSGAFAPISNYKLFIATDNCALNGALGRDFSRDTPKGLYFKAIDIPYYKTATNWSNYASRLVGVIDGANVYGNIKNRGVSMGYPTLTGIDTEANIQLLTPADGSLYLASDTGDLWQYTNGAWTNLFGTDFAGGATWYSDEDCTITIEPSDITSDMTVYVKLTAI